MSDVVYDVKGVANFNAVLRIERRKNKRKQIHSHFVNWENSNFLRLSENPNEVKKSCKDEGNQP